MIAKDVSSAVEMQLVTFNLGDERFGVDIMNVQEIIRTPEITRVPRTPEYVDGITNLRGRLLPIVDTRTKFGMEQDSRDGSSRVIVMDVNGKMLGLNVDSVSQVMTVKTEDIEAAPASLADHMKNGLIRGVVRDTDGKRLVMILGTSYLIDTQSESGNKGPGRSIDVKRDIKEAGVREETQIVSFLAGSEEYGLEIDTVREIIRFPEIVKVPNVPSYIKGMISLRDTLMPIVDLRTKLKANSDQITDGTRVIVIDVNGSLIGLTVDRVFEVLRLRKDEVFPPPQAISNSAGERVTGIAHLNGGKRLIMLMDFQEMVNAQLMEDLVGEAELSDAPSGVGNGEHHEEQMVVFKLAGEQFGVTIHQVQEITKMSTITRVPRAPSYVKGVVNLRGDVIPVLDLRNRFDVESRKYDYLTRIIVSDIGKRKVGIIVDEVLEVVRVPHSRIEKMPGVVQEQQLQKYMVGLANLNDRMIMMLDLENLLHEKEWEVVNNLGEQDNAEKKPSSRIKMKKQKVK
ncbi:MAG: chemotaxis protein CheW [Syntrophomonas sp.]